MAINGKHKNEEVSSTYGYLSGYTPLAGVSSWKKVQQDLERQAYIISRLFNIGESFDIKCAKRMWGDLPKGAEKLFLIPDPAKVALIYSSAVYQTLLFMASERKLDIYHYIREINNRKVFFQSTHEQRAFKTFRGQQSCYTNLVTPAQFGYLHRGRSCRRANSLMGTHEIPCGTYTVSVMLLTHPERLAHHDDLWINCSGDNLVHENNSSASALPESSFFEFSDGVMGIGFGNTKDAIDYFGSASMFLP